MNTPTDPRTGREYLLHTCHGSRLYGLAHADSDEDWYMVTPDGGRKIRQRIKQDQDTLTLPLGEFARMIHNGNPQALEALFSPLADRGALDAYRYQFLPDTGKTLYTHERTMKTFALSGTFKGRRHALRLGRNMDQFTRTGRFNPMLDAQEKETLSEAANSTPAEYMAFLLGTSPLNPFYEREEEYLQNLKDNWT